MNNYKKYIDSSFWIETLPTLNIEKNKDIDHKIVFNDNKILNEQNRLEFDGYFKFENLLDSKEIDILKSSIENLSNRDILPVFICLYDEFWNLVYSMKPFVEKLIGEDYMIFPDFWVWHIDHNEEEAGWSPHRDENVDSKDKNYPNTSLTFWVSLSDATTENGCMHVLPKSLDNAYPSGLDFTLTTLQNIRALPVPSGSILGWNQSLFHWGGRSSRYAKEKRMSFAFEIQPLSFLKSKKGMIDNNQIPSFKERLKIVSNQILQYSHIHSEKVELLEFAKYVLNEDANGSL